MFDKGFVHIYQGNGKGKTSSAAGLCVRFAGSGQKAVFAQFLKGQLSSECEALAKLGVKVIKPEQSTKFVPFMDSKELSECKEIQKNCLISIENELRTGMYGLLILDEILDVISLGLIDEAKIIHLIKSNPHLEVVLTGRRASPQLEALADYISEINNVRHPYEKGITARKGIEY